MNFDLRQALLQLQNGTVFQIANQARPGSNYLLNAILPEEPRFSYQATAGNMIVRSTMAGLVGMDSPYPQGGAIDVTKFSEETAKIAIRMRLPEQQLRELQEMLFRLSAGRGNTIQAIQNVALNFTNHIIIQAMLDTMEWLRGQALTLGYIDWVFNNKRLLVNYGIPATNMLPARTGASGYGGNASVFWSDMRLLRRRLKNDVRAYIMHSETKDMILSNPANNIRLLSEDLTRGTFSVVRRIQEAGGGTTDSSDPRDRANFVTYDEEGEVWDLANPGMTKKLSFFARGVITAIGGFNQSRRFVIGTGSTPPPTPVQIGYTHLAPTVEGGGTPGRWADVGTPFREPWAIESRGAMNGLPVIEAPDRVATATTEMI